MIKTVSDEQIEQEKGTGYKPQATNIGMDLLPLVELGDREFELLSYLLVKHEIDNSFEKNFTSISLMQGVGERGRDCILYKDGILKGLIQCKKVRSRISRPAVIKEIIKFLLFAKLDGTLLPDPSDFRYTLYVANDLSEPAIKLMNSHVTEIENEVKNGKFSQYVNEVVEEYESFSTLINTPPTQEILNNFKKINVSYCNSVDLCLRISQAGQLIASFFRTVNIIDLKSAEQMLKEVLQDYGLKALTDNDIKDLQERIGNIEIENRISFGFVDYFGFSKDFFDYLSKESFIGMIKDTVALRTTLDNLVITYLQHKINEKISSEITLKLLENGVIHPFSVSFAGPYLLRKILPSFLGKSVPANILPSTNLLTSLSKDIVKKIVCDEIIQSSEKVMNGDTSHLIGSPETIQLKLELFSHMHQGFSDINDAKTQLDKDLVILQPTLDRIESEILKMINPTRTIIIKDTAFFDNKEKLKHMFETIKTLDSK